MRVTIASLRGLAIEQCCAVMQKSLLTQVLGQKVSTLILGWDMTDRNSVVSNSFPDPVVLDVDVSATFAAEELVSERDGSCVVLQERNRAWAWVAQLIEESLDRVGFLASLTKSHEL